MKKIQYFIITYVSLLIGAVIFLYNDLELLSGILGIVSIGYIIAIPVFNVIVYLTKRNYWIFSITFLSVLNLISYVSNSSFITGELFSEIQNVGEQAYLNCFLYIHFTHLLFPLINKFLSKNLILEMLNQVQHDNKKQKRDAIKHPLNITSFTYL